MGSAAWPEALNPPRREVTFVPTQACWTTRLKRIVFLFPKLLSSYQWYLSAAADTYQVTYKGTFQGTQCDFSHYCLGWHTPHYGCMCVLPRRNHSPETPKCVLCGPQSPLRLCRRLTPGGGFGTVKPIKSTMEPHVRKQTGQEHNRIARSA